MNGTGHAPAQKSKKKAAAAEQPVDQSQVIESVRNRIAALEEVEVHEEEEERRFGACVRRPSTAEGICGQC